MMVLPLRPSKFYGSSLPRPRIYGDLKFNAGRVDPPLGVTSALLSWAMDAHWSMGGLSLKRKRMAGKIEGNVKKLREEDEKDTRKKISPDKKKKKEGKEKEKRVSPAKADADTGSPIKKASSPVHSAADRSPPEGQLIKQKWAKEDDLEDEDCPTVVPLSIENSGVKRSSPVRRRIRKLGEVFKQQIVTAQKSCHGVSSDLGIESLKVHSGTRSASKREVRKEAQVYDYVAVPEKIIKTTPRKEKNQNAAGIEPGSLVSPVRRSSRFAASTPLAPIKKGHKKILIGGFGLEQPLF